jgi:hypothetical protein
MMRISFGWLQAIWTRQDQAHPVAAASGVSPTHDIKRTRHRANIFWLIEFFPTGFFSLIQRTNKQTNDTNKPSGKLFYWRLRFYVFYRFPIVGHSFLLRVSPTGFTVEVLTRPLGLSFTAFTYARGRCCLNEPPSEYATTTTNSTTFRFTVCGFIGRTQTCRATTRHIWLCCMEGHIQRYLRKLRDEA